MAFVCAESVQTKATNQRRRNINVTKIPRAEKPKKAPESKKPYHTPGSILISSRFYVYHYKPLQKTVTCQEAILTVFWARVVSDAGEIKPVSPPPSFHPGDIGQAVLQTRPAYPGRRASSSPTQMHRQSNGQIPGIEWRVPWGPGRNHYYQRKRD